MSIRGVCRGRMGGSDDHIQLTIAFWGIISNEENKMAVLILNIESAPTITQSAKCK